MTRGGCYATPLERSPLEWEDLNYRVSSAFRQEEELDYWLTMPVTLPPASSEPQFGVSVALLKPSS